MCHNTLKVEKQDNDCVITDDDGFQDNDPDQESDQDRKMTVRECLQTEERMNCYTCPILL